MRPRWPGRADSTGHESRRPHATHSRPLRWMSRSPRPSHLPTSTTRAALPKLPGKAKPITPAISHVWVGRGLHRSDPGQRRSRGLRHRRRGVQAETRTRIHSPTPQLGRRTHQRLDQPLPPHRLPLRNHPHPREGIVYLSQTALLLHRLDRSQLFDTLSRALAVPSRRSYRYFCS